jgi:hypothetical protein
MCEPGPLHRWTEIEDLTHLTDDDKSKLSQESEKGKDFIQPNQHLSLQDIHKTLFNQQNSNPK